MTDQVPLSPEMLVPRLGDALIEKGILTEADLQRALAAQETFRKEGKFLRFGQVLVDLSLVEQRTLDSVIAEQILKLRAALEEANAQLERRVIERTAQLQEALQKLSELSQVKSNFVANISHELRTPLTHLKGYLDLMLSGDLGVVTLDQQRALQVMYRASERLGRLIEDLILFSMAERGDVTLRIARANLSSLCLALVNRTLGKAGEKKIALELICPPQPVFAEIDEEKYSWVILQLLDNAIKFTPAQGQVWVELHQEGAFVSVGVRDTGIGIPADRLAEIFEPFHQLDGSSTRRYGGTGIGLSLARKIIEAHGSMIHVHSEEGKGSTFEFVLKAS
jgi:signal transduction histidine kinase